MLSQLGSGMLCLGSSQTALSSACFVGHEEGGVVMHEVQAVAA